MLEPKIANACEYSGFLCPHQGCIPLAQAHYGFERVFRQKFAKAPNAARIAKIMRAAAVTPELLEIAGAEVLRLDGNFEQIAAMRTGQSRLVQFQYSAAAGTAAQMRHVFFQNSIEGEFDRSLMQEEQIVNEQCKR